MHPDISPLVTWINEREAIRIRKDMLNRDQEAKRTGSRTTISSRELAAWDRGGWSFSRLTADPILREYRFCNVQREHDRVTVWIRENIREPFADHPHLWYMLAAARYINWPETLDELISSGHAAWPIHTDFTPAGMTKALEQRRARGEKMETGAYMIRAESDPNAPWYSWSKQRYVSEVVLGKLWERREFWQGWLEDEQPDLQGTWNFFQDKHYTGWGPFMAYQVVVDLRWTRYLRDAPDIQTWAAVGPGSRRGLNRLYDRPVDFALKQDHGLAEMIELRERLSAPGILAPWVSLPDLSDIQNCLCETDKYLRVQNGEGRPRSKYVPGRGH